MPKEMSWLSPKRRRTTGNLKTLHTTATDQQPAYAAPTIPIRPTVQPAPERAVSHLGVSRSTPTSPEPVGNLFYAYARRDGDSDRYLLTFASAAVANEWWLLTQAHFPECSRPGPQLFNFRDPEFLTNVWRHGDFAHLKSKWMYISFGDARTAQGMIPVQDAEGNLLGGSAPASPESGKVRREMGSEIARLEAYFDKMMEAVGRNLEQVAHLEGQTRAAGGAFDMSELSASLGQINEVLSKHLDHAEAMERRQAEDDQKLQGSLQDLVAKQKGGGLNLERLEGHLERIQGLVEQTVQERRDSVKEVAVREAQKGEGLDLSQLSGHLDRIQNLVEQTVQQRGDSVAGRESQSVKIDFSPLTDRLEKVQEAVEQNSALIKALLDEGTVSESKPGTPFWGKDTPVQPPPPQIDMSPLADHLQKIHEAINLQSSHMQALVGFASGDAEGSESTEHTNAGPLAITASDTAEKSLAPLNEHLEQIYNAIEEGNNSAHIPAKLDELISHVEALREWTEFDSEQLKELVDTAKATYETRMDLTPITDVLNQHMELQKREPEPPEPGSGDPKFLLSALTSHLSRIQAVTDANAQHIRSLREESSAKDAALAQTAEQIRVLAEFNAQHVKVSREESSAKDITIAQAAEQVRALAEMQRSSEQRVAELVEEQRGMVDAVRLLARTREVGCGHVVVPPPRKMGRRIVGYVYDGKEVE